MMSASPGIVALHFLSGFSHDGADLIVHLIVLHGTKYHTKLQSSNTLCK